MLSRLATSVYAHLWRLPRFRRIYKKLSVAETFRDVYRNKYWGDNGTPFYSGQGSHGSVARQYCDFVSTFIRNTGVESVVDLGCGDFAIGRRIVENTDVRYSGIDVVPELIEYHQHTSRDSRVTFQCADITTDMPPVGELCLLRQVLQHLSNSEILRVLATLKSFSWVLISEDVPVHPRFFNRDKLHGPDVRAYYDSGVYIDRAPFSMIPTQIWEIPLTRNTVLRTTLIDQTCCNPLRHAGETSES
jgi:SAM-dependent methyltransferase